MKHLFDIEIVFQISMVTEDFTDPSQMFLKLLFQGFMSERWHFLLLFNEFEVMKVQVGF